MLQPSPVWTSPGARIVRWREQPVNLGTGNPRPGRPERGFLLHLDRRSLWFDAASQRRRGTGGDYNGSCPAA